MTIPDRYPIPHIQDFTATLHGSTIFQSYGTAREQVYIKLRALTRVLAEFLRVFATSTRASLAEPLLASYLRVHAYCTSVKYSRVFVHVRT